LGDVPGTQSAAIVSELPALGDSRSSPVLIEGDPAPAGDHPWVTEVRVISQDYFRTVEIPVRAGRPFVAEDAAGNLPAAIVSANAAQRFWQGRDVLGKRIRLSSADWNTPWLTVVGVVGDVNQFFLDTEILPTVYLPYTQQPLRALHFVVRSTSKAEGTGAAVRSAVLATDATQRIYDLKSINSFYSDLTGGVGVIARLMETFAFLALLLSAAGIFALMAYSVAQRTHDIGIRMALGAQRQHIRQLILRNALKLVVGGLVLGLPGAVALSVAMSSVLPAVVTPEPVTFLAFAILLSTVALAACYFPLRKATTVDPVVALRY